MHLTEILSWGACFIFGRVEFLQCLQSTLYHSTYNVIEQVIILIIMIIDTIIIIITIITPHRK